MRNNLLSGTVGGMVGTILNTPYVSIVSQLTLVAWIFNQLTSCLFLFCALASMSSSRESKVQRTFPESLPNTAGHTLRKYPLRCPFFPAVDEPGCSRLVTIMREEGPAALYKGFVPKVLRLAPGGGVLLLVVEFTLEVFRKSSSSSPLFPPISIHLTFSSLPFDSPWTSLPLSTLHFISEPKEGWVRCWVTVLERCISVTVETQLPDIYLLISTEALHAAYTSETETSGIEAAPALSEVGSQPFPVPGNLSFRAKRLPRCYSTCAVWRRCLRSDHRSVS